MLPLQKVKSVSKGDVKNPKRITVDTKKDRANAVSTLCRILNKVDRHYSTSCGHGLRITTIDDLHYSKE